MAGRPGTGGDTSGFSFDDGGAINRLAVQLGAAGMRAGAKAFAITQKFGVVLQGRVKANAAGRPGPRIQTGDYNRSISLRVAMDGLAVEASVGTVRPQGRRLEFGFVGTDSLGRSYDQPAYPHFGPAHSDTAPQFAAAIATIADDVLDEPGPDTKVTP